MALTGRTKLALTGAVLGAATVLGPIGCVEQTLTVDSNPPGALVYLNDQEIGRTPLKRDFLWYGNYEVVVRTEGYETINTTADIEPPWWNNVPLDLLAALLPATLRDTDHHLTYTLKPAPSHEPEVTGLLSRAQEMREQLESSEYTRPATTRATTQP